VDTATLVMEPGSAGFCDRVPWITFPVSRPESVDLAALCERAPNPLLALRTVQAAMVRDPVLPAPQARRNYTGIYNNLRSRSTVQIHSLGEEKAARLYDHAPGVAVFCEQRLWLRVAREFKGAVRETDFAPDMMVLYLEEGLFVEEWKTRADVEELCRTEPQIFFEGPDRFISPPIERAVMQQTGARFRIRTFDEIPDTLDRNLEDLEDYETRPRPPAEEFVRLWLPQLEANACVRLDELIGSPSAEKQDAIRRMLVAGMVHVDLTEERLDRPGRVWVFGDLKRCQERHDRRHSLVSAIPELEIGLIKIGAVVDWDGTPWRIQNPGHDHVSMSPVAGPGGADIPNSRFEELLQRGDIVVVGTPESQDDGDLTAIPVSVADEADIRLELVRAHLEKREPGVAHRSPASERRYRTRYHKAIGDGVDPWVALFPERGGFAGDHLEEDQRSCLQEGIKDFYQNADARGKTNAYRLYREREIRGHRVPVSIATFRREIKAQGEWANMDARRGQRGSHGVRPRTGFGSARNLNPRPLERVQFDMTLADVTSFEPDSKDPFDRPTLAVAVDQCGSKVLADSLTYETPAYAITARLIYLIALLYHRLARLHIVDNGKEFDTLPFEAVLRRYWSRLRHRPPGEPKIGGQLIENTIGITGSQFFHALRGNTEQMRDPRRVSTTHFPSTRAAWPLDALSERLHEYYHRVYNRVPHGPRGKSPDQIWESAWTDTGLRDQLLIPSKNMQRLFIDLLPLADGGTRLVRATYGVVVDYTKYWAPTLVPHDGENLRVKQDFYDVSRVFVGCDNTWLECRAPFYDEWRQMPSFERSVRNEAMKIWRKRAGSLDSPAQQALGRFQYDTYLEGEQHAAGRRSGAPAISSDDSSTNGHRPNWLGVSIEDVKEAPEWE
jgi:hypothetical protein